jgi:hypothetical protein
MRRRPGPVFLDECLANSRRRGKTRYFPRVAGTFKERAGWHGCQMPEQLLGRIIRACSNPGELVLDPFGGSGMTLVTAKKLGRRFLGSELSPDYAAAIRRRLDEAHPGQALSGSPESTAGGRGAARGRRADEQGVAEPLARTVCNPKPCQLHWHEFGSWRRFTTIGLIGFEEPERKGHVETVFITFPDRETEKRVIALLIRRFSGRVLRSGEHLMPEAALEALAD